jgi:hypothetical protein
MISTKIRKKILSHLHGCPDYCSQDELRIHQLILCNLRNKPDSEYEFYFNEAITTFGVPTKSIMIQDCRDAFIAYVMNRCDVERYEAIEFVNMIDSPIRTNTLLLDVGKVLDGKLIMALESNRGSHYIVPDDMEKRKKFARGLFADFVKETELKKITEFVEVNHWAKNIGSKDSIRQELMVEQFVSV